MLPVEGNSETCVEQGQRCQACSNGRRAVVALLDRDELVALRLTTGDPVIADEADCAVDRIRSAECEVNVVEIARSALGQCCGKPDCRLRTEAEIGRRIGKFAHLAGCRLDDRFLTVAGIDAPEAREAIDQLLARGVCNRRAFGGREDANTELLVIAIGGDRMHEMGAVEFDKGIAIHDTLRISRAPGWRGQIW